jgi:hypothetical protein
MSHGSLGPHAWSRRSLSLDTDLKRAPITARVFLAGTSARGSRTKAPYKSDHRAGQTRTPLPGH